MRSVKQEEKNAVLQRKIADAAAAGKKLMELPLCFQNKHSTWLCVWLVVCAEAQDRGRRCSTQSSLLHRLQVCLQY